MVYIDFSGFVPLKLLFQTYSKQKTLNENDEINKIHINDAVRCRPDDQLY